MNKAEAMTAIVFHENHAQRLDCFLTKAFPNLSRSKVQMFIRSGCVLLSELVIFDPNHRIQKNDVYYIKPPKELAPSSLIPEHMDFFIYYEDDDCLVLEKPAGLVVHPGAGVHQATLVHGLLAYCGQHLSKTAGDERAGLVHRLDKETSGLMVIAKTDQAHRHISAQFASRRLEKIYWAFVRDIPSPSFGRLETLIGRHPQNRQKMAILLGKGRIAITVYQTLKTSKIASLLECRPYTGRTHQIRVHCASIGHPILGDVVYGHRHGYARHALHAKKLSFFHPRTEKWMIFESPLPDDLNNLYQKFFI